MHRNFRRRMRSRVGHHYGNDGIFAVARTLTLRLECTIASGKFTRKPEKPDSIRHKIVLREDDSGAA
jgi:hypothetical protein